MSSTERRHTLELEGEDLDAVRTMSEWAVVYIATGVGDQTRSISLTWLEEMRRVVEAHGMTGSPGVERAHLELQHVGALLDTADGLRHMHSCGVEDVRPGDPAAYLTWHEERLATVERAIDVLERVDGDLGAV